MEENVKEELNTLKQMVKNWCLGYLGWCDDGDNEYVIDELKEDIQRHLVPYVRRFISLEYMTLDEVNVFWNDISDLVNQFAEDVKDMKKEKPEVDIGKLYSQFTVHKDLIEGGHCDAETEKAQRSKLIDVAISLIPALMDKLCKCGGKCNVG